MRPLWTVAEVVKATGGRPEGLSDGPLSAVSIDSREIGPEALFVAIRGDSHDGHDYVLKALEAGASAAIVSEAYHAGHGGDRLIVVPDTLEALGGLGKAARARVLSGAIAANPRRMGQFKGAQVLLVDDVLTSGATSGACVAALRRAGANEVRLACFAQVLDEALDAAGG